MRSSLLMIVVLMIVGDGAPSWAGGRQARRAAAQQSAPMLTPNGTVVPAWAARRIENSPVPLFAPYSGRRPWAYALAQANTPSGRWARGSQLGIGAGPVPGFTNGPPLGNYPQAAVGPNDTAVPPQQGFFGFPFNVYINGN